MIPSRAGRVVTAIAAVSLLAFVSVTGTPAAADAGSGEDAWYQLAEDAAVEAERTDWAALSAATGCTLLAVEVTELVDPDLNAELGAPSDLALPLVEREERCADDVAPAAAPGPAATVAPGMTAAVAPGGDCSTTSGPGTVCIARSGGYVTSSFQYAGSGTIRAFLKLYSIPTSASGCPTGAGLATGGTYSYTDGTRRSLSVYAPGYGGYSVHVWRYVGVGVHTDWGAACGAL